MLYLDMMTQEGGQVYLDIFSVEPLKKHRSTGFSLQGVLGDGYAEAHVLVEYLDAKATLTFIDSSHHCFMADEIEGEDLLDNLHRALQSELEQAESWLGMNYGREDSSISCSLRAGERWYGTESGATEKTQVPVVREAVSEGKFDQSCRVERCFLFGPAVKKVQNRKRSLHAHPCSRLNQPLSTTTLATAGVELRGRCAPLQGIS